MRRHGDLRCGRDVRRSHLRAHPTLTGIDFLEVASAPDGEEQVLLKVRFIEKSVAPERVAQLAALLEAEPSRVRIEGGVRVRDVRVESVKAVTDDPHAHLLVRVREPGDHSTYTLVLDASGRLDPERARVDFSFKAGCPARFDCKPRDGPAPPPAKAPAFDYMAKDFASFRQGMLDLLAVLAPARRERHEADVEMMLVDLLAYAGDRISYHQDAVANEAHLATARRRVYVRRHARLVDYAMHDGAGARAFVHVGVRAPCELPAGTKVLSRLALDLLVPPGPGGSPRPLVPPLPAALPVSVEAQARPAADVVFETYRRASLHPLLNEIPLYDWDDDECCLPEGATRAHLLGRFEAHLRPGDFLVFEQTRSPDTGRAADADRTKRQVVRLTRVEDRPDDPVPMKDGVVTPKPHTLVEWAASDALRFALPLAATLDGNVRVGGLAVARGNLVLADHGRTLVGEKVAGPPAPPPPGPRRAHRVALSEGPLSQRHPYPAEGVSVAAMERAEPSSARPEVKVAALGRNGLPVSEWTPEPTLLDCDPYATSFVAETENDGRALLRFGDDVHGASPPEGSELLATYRVGVGRRGNVGADALAHVLVEGDALASVREVRNPVPAWGGEDPEPVERVRRLAPVAFRATQHRAVTADDYERVAEKHPAVSKALARFRWTGSWLTVFLTVDPVGRVALKDDDRASLLAWVRRHAQTGYDLRIDDPKYVPLVVEIHACATRDRFAADVERDLLEVLGPGVRPDGRKGFFHPDHWTFGDPLHVSRLYAAIESVPGVDSAQVVAMHRQGAKGRGEPEKGYVAVGRREILRLDNDPNAPENGVLRVRVGGGR